ncbi:MAG: PQQ-binding-like beta-propeller repeat protein, partial [Pseudohongiella nitratireducens]|nr:PQQ-binding-like beta-propeller repeat protein [Pseudohongiella nitratireducens]
RRNRPREEKGVNYLEKHRNSGGYNWGSLAIDEEQQIMVGSAMTLPNHLRLVPREEVDAGVPASPQLGTPYGASTVTFVSPLGIPCSEPPFGVLTAIDLQTQDLLWKRPIGTTNDLGPLGTKIGLPMEIGTPVSGGTMVTKGGLVFFAGTLDRRFRAFDIHTGKELWKHALPQSAQATPMTYVSPESHQQTVVVTLPGVGQNYTVGVSGEAEDDPQGGYIMAFRLKNR